MTIVEVLAVLGSVGSIGGGYAAVREMLLEPRANDQAVREAVARLPQHASAETVVEVLGQYAGVGGSLAVTAGHDGGGHIVARDVDWAAGNGSRRGGDTIVSAGNGGPNGPGGDVTIVGGTIRAGDAK